jgi:hypothetical protein
MASLTDLSNPTFLMFLGILLLAIALFLLVLYFESKFRDQNHKITSMLSLVSSLAEEVNNSKMMINHLTMMGAGKGMSQNIRNPYEKNNSDQNNNSELIAVSDDEEDDDEDNDEDDDSEINDDSSDSDDEEETPFNLEENTIIQIGEPSDVRVFKINISENDTDSDNNSNNIDILDELDELDDTDSESTVENIEENTQSNSITLESNNNKELLDSSLFELKSINISSLEEEKEKEKEEDKEIIDFKKLTLNKLRDIVIKKGLSNDALKLKKNDLLKLLEID